jgi:hypothetical protein
LDLRNNVEDRLGPGRYLFFYLLSAAGFFFSSSMALSASRRDKAVSRGLPGGRTSADSPSDYSFAGVWVGAIPPQPRWSTMKTGIGDPTNQSFHGIPGFETSSERANIHKSDESPVKSKVSDVPQGRRLV